MRIINRELLDLDDVRALIAYRLYMTGALFQVYMGWRESLFLASAFHLAYSAHLVPGNLS